MEKLLKEDFDNVFSLMETSFPKDEYRPYEEQKALLENPAYSLYGQKSGGQLQGFMALWKFDGFTFIEHFAVNPAFRNGGIGSGMLQELVNAETGRVCLEVELPDNDLASRRIGFYRRNRFFLNDYPYMQPSISKGRTPVPLRIMTWKEPVSEEDFETIRTVLYREVYRCV